MLIAVSLVHWSRMQRRQYLSGIAGLGALSALPGVAGAETFTGYQAGEDGYHPGPPRVMHAGERIVDPPHADYKGDSSPDDRDLLAPRLPDPERDPDGYGPDAFTWRVAETPADSDLEGFYSHPDEYDYGTNNVVEFDPDAPGTYSLELDAPDGTHELTVRVFPEPIGDAAGPPRVRPTAEFDADAGEFVVEANAAVAPDSETPPSELAVEFLADDRDSLDENDISVEGTTARVPADAVDGTARLHTVAVDDRPGVIETLELDAESGESLARNAPPEWLKDATMYSIFTRSFGSEPGEADFAFLRSKVDYLADLGVDVVWLTPVVDATSHREENPVGGPHGYDTVNYFQTADALGSVAEYEAFVEACHERDIKVCFDLVINHTARAHPFFQDAAANGSGSPYYEFYERMADGSEANYFSWSDLMNVNYQWLAAREHILSVVDYWADVVDGFRCDVGYGVTHGFWKEVRRLVKDRDREVFLLDETIPYMRRFSEQEFDQHYDDILYETLVDVGQGLAADHLLDAIAERKRRGIPDRTIFLQYVENHDLPRYLDSVDKQAERAAAAATFTLPGTPMLYYGQERALAEYSDSRVSEDGHVRAFMNWDDYDADHLAFYESLITAREEIPALQHDADVVGAYYRCDSENVVAYGRDAGDQKVVVVLNFGDGSQEVTLRGPVSTTDLVTETDVGLDRDDDLTHVEVDSVAVLETPSLSGLGTHVTSVDDEAGDDTGTGGYTYPTGEAYADGAFDLTGVDVYETETADQLRFTFDGPVENPRGYDGGFSVQHLQVYVRDPTDSGGRKQAREGVGATLDERYQYRIVGDGEHGVRVERPDGEVVATGSAFASPSTGSIRLDVPDHAVPGDLTEKQLAAMVLGYDPDAPGSVAHVGESADENQFGGGSESAPGIVDLVVPEGHTQGEVLAAGEVPYVLPSDPIGGELIAEWDDETGDDTGPGGYTYPTGDGVSEGAFDIDAFDVYDDGDRYRFVYTLAGDLSNPHDGAYGFSSQHPQVYLRNPGADAPTATAGREGTHVSLAEPYHYRVVASGFGGESVVENGAGEVVTEDVTVAAYQSLDAITITVPKAAVGGEIDAAAVAPLLCPAAPDGGIEPIQPEATETAVGGGTGGDDPAVVDTVVPGDADQAAAIADGTLPLLPLSTFSGTLLRDWDDETGDDHGPGSYTYPEADILTPGTFDITGVELYETGDRYRFVYYLNDEITNPWSGSQDFSLYLFQVYLRDPAAAGDRPSSTTGRDGTNTEFEQPDHYRIAVDGYSIQAVEAADGTIRSQDVTTQVHPDLRAVAFAFPKSALEGGIERMQFAPLIFGYDGFATGRIRAVNAEAGEWQFGGGSPEGTHSKALDVITPDGVSQSEAMAFSADSRAALPFVPQKGGGGSPTAAADSPESVTATETVQLGATASSDPDEQSLRYEWTQTDGPEATLSDPSAPQPTITAPEVESAATLSFEVTVSDPDGNSATATTSVTVKPATAESDETTESDGSDETTTESDEETTADTDRETTTSGSDGESETAGADGETDEGDGPGFGALTGLLGVAGGAAYAGRKRLSSEGEEDS